MTTPARRLRRTVGELALALLNATLILAALCLFLAWRAAATVEQVTETVTTAAAGHLAAVAPLRDELGAARGELAALRADLDRLSAGGAVSDALSARLAAAEARLDALSDRAGQVIDTLPRDAGALVDRAVTRGVDRAGRWAAGLRGCTLPPRDG